MGKQCLEGRKMVVGFGWDSWQKYCAVGEVVVEILEHDVLEVAVIRSKFGHASNNQDVGQISNSLHRSPWKGISQVLHKSLPYTKLSLGCVNLIRFWLDPWADPITFGFRFPRLYSTSSLKGGVISSFKSLLTNWNFHFHGTSEILKLTISRIY